MKGGQDRDTIIEQSNTGIRLPATGILNNLLEPS
jgi:hypothetical protein